MIYVLSRRVSDAIGYGNQHPWGLRDYQVVTNYRDLQGLRFESEDEIHFLPRLFENPDVESVLAHTCLLLDLSMPARPRIVWLCSEDRYKWLPTSPPPHNRERLEAWLSE